MNVVETYLNRYEAFVFVTRLREHKFYRQKHCFTVWKGLDNAWSKMV